MPLDQGRWLHRVDKVEYVEGRRAIQHKDLPTVRVGRRQRPRELLVPTGLPWRVGSGNSPWRRVLAGASPKPLEIRLSGHGRRRGHAGRLAN